MAAPTYRERTTALLQTALGSAVYQALSEDLVTDVYTNADGVLWTRRLDIGRQATGVTLPAEDRARAIRLVADHVGVILSPERPAIDAELPELGERFSGALPPIVAAPTFSIRKHASRVFLLEDFVRQEVISPSQAKFLKAALRARKNILISGATGSGKTTFANALLAELAAGANPDRIVIIEDTLELKCQAPDVLSLRASDHVTIRDLVKLTLRNTPDRIVIGEVRDGAALDLVKAWRTGHGGGLGTLHADSAAGALERLEALILEVAQNAHRHDIAAAVNVVVHITGRGATRRVQTLAEVLGCSAGAYQLAERA